MNSTETRTVQERLREQFDLLAMVQQDLGPSLAAVQIACARHQISQAISRIDALEKALKSVEFGILGRCQICAGWMVGPHGETDRVHTKDCPIAAALRGDGRK